MSLIAEHHAPIADCFYTGVGMELMFEESEVMVALLLRLKAEGVVALPLHDGILVPCDRVEAAEVAMREVFRERTGLEAVVEVAHSPGQHGRGPS